MSFDFSKLAENSVKGIYAGHNYRASASRETDRQRVDPQGAIHVTASSSNPNVMVNNHISSSLTMLIKVGYSGNRATGLMDF
jgi:hypothetical protein